MNKATVALSILMGLFLPMALAQKPQIDPAAPSSDQIQVLRTIRGDIFFGAIRRLDADSLIFITQEALQLQYRRAEIGWLGPLQNAGWLRHRPDALSGTFFRMQDVTYFGHENLAYSTTAFGLPKGEAEFRNINVLYNTVDVGLSSRFSIGGGMVVPFLLIGRAKVTAAAGEQVHLGLGVNNFLSLIPDASGLASHAFAVATIGNPRQFLNFTVGPAIDWAFQDFTPIVVTGGGSTFIGNSWRLYADIGFTPAAEGLIPTIMVNWHNRMNRFECGLLGVITQPFIALPILGYARRF